MLPVWRAPLALQEPQDQVASVGQGFEGAAVFENDERLQLAGPGHRLRITEREAAVARRQEPLDEGLRKGRQNGTSGPSSVSGKGEATRLALLWLHFDEWWQNLELSRVVYVIT
jgi:hypothetical protein